MSKRACFRGNRPVVAAIVILLSGAVLRTYAVDWDNFDPEDYEEPAGSTFAFLLNPEDGIYGLSVGSGTWLKNTPVFGDFAISLFHNDLEQALYSGIAMTIRAMPHWQYAPFVGCGGSFNYSFASGSSDESSSGIPAETVVAASRRDSESYWAGHVEAGVRGRFGSRVQLVEVAGRYNWSSSGDEFNYWLVALSTGAGW
ncbi:MAG: hypothetical protein E4H02_07985 [Lentisphaerales bacterium]|jgi:hypothetical protein|nr:MAG: hypothetical protein E4H02_07985 [Lentisphaerales bacterium]